MNTLVERSSPFVPTESQLHMAYSVCSGITRSRAKNFYYGILVLPKRKRQAISAVYAFMRRCDDIADAPSLSAVEYRIHQVPADQPVTLTMERDGVLRDVTLTR